MAVKVEVFVSEPPCSGGRLLLRLMDEVKRQCGDMIEVEVHRGPTREAEAYGIKVSPAVVIDCDIRIIGVCPTKATLLEALREAGLPVD
ncbi:MAG: hypothetical protein QXW94_04145 [Desulfurococcaceae archaeon]